MRTFHNQVTTDCHHGHIHSICSAADYMRASFQCSVRDRKTVWRSHPAFRDKKKGMDYKNNTSHECCLITSSQSTQCSWRSHSRFVYVPSGDTILDRKCLWDITYQKHLLTLCPVLRWRSTPRWTWLSLTSWTMSWGVAASTTAKGRTCTDVMQVSAQHHFPLSQSLCLALLLIDVLFPPWRRCLQRRDRRPVWAPEANHQQLCVVLTRAQHKCLPMAPRHYSGWAEDDGHRLLGPQDSQYQRTGKQYLDKYT